MKKTNEGWDDMLAAAKAKRGPQPSGGAGIKQGSRYGGSKSKVDTPVPTKGPSVSQIRKLQDKITKAKSKNEQTQIDELSKDTLLRYKDAAKADKADADLNRKSGDIKQIYHGVVRSNKRDAGLTKAWKRIHTKEEVEEALVGNQHKLDKNKNGKLDKDDFKKIRGEEKDTVVMNPKMKNTKSAGQANCESVKSADKEPEEYTDSKGRVKYRMVSKDKNMKVESKIRESLMSVLEKKDPHTAGAISQPMQDDVTLSGAGAKKMKADHEPKLELDANKSPDENKKAELAGPNGKARPNDNNQGDKKVINPVADVTKKATTESFIDKISAIYKSMVK